MRILIPPPECCSDSTHEVLFDSQVLSVDNFWSQYCVPTDAEGTSDPGSNHSDVSPSLIGSEAIRAEFGPRNADPDVDDEHSQLQIDADVSSFMQVPDEPASSSHDPPPLAPQIAQIISESCLLSFDPTKRPWPHWFRGLSTAFWDTAVIENEDEGPVAYFDSWYADCRSESVSEASRPIRLDHLGNMWSHDIQHVWRDRIQPGASVFVAWVVPTPPPLPLTRSSGHLIIYQFPHPNFVPFIVSIQFIALRVEGFSHAIAVLDRHSAALWTSSTWHEFVQVADVHFIVELREQHGLTL